MTDDITKVCAVSTVFVLRGRTLYNLYAVVNHVGDSFDGHYTASARHPYTGQWHCFNDHM